VKSLPEPEGMRALTIAISLVNLPLLAMSLIDVLLVYSLTLLLLLLSLLSSSSSLFFFLIFRSSLHTDNR
jgi:hypothetical protein